MDWIKLIVFLLANFPELIKIIKEITGMLKETAHKERAEALELFKRLVKNFKYKPKK